MNHLKKILTLKNKKRSFFKTYIKEQFSPQFSATANKVQSIRIKIPDIGVPLNVQKLLYLLLLHNWKSWPNQVPRIPIVYAKIQQVCLWESPTPISQLIITHNENTHKAGTYKQTHTQTISCTGLISGRNNYCNHVILTKEQIRSQSFPLHPPLLSLKSPRSCLPRHTHTQSQRNTGESIISYRCPSSFSGCFGHFKRFHLKLGEETMKQFDKIYLTQWINAGHKCVNLISVVPRWYCTSCWW